MLKKEKDGWHNFYGNDIYVEDGKVLRGNKGSDFSYVTVYPYRWDSNRNCWINVSGITVAAFRAGIKRGTIELK